MEGIEPSGLWIGSPGLHQATPTTRRTSGSRRLDPPGTHSGVRQRTGSVRASRTGWIAPLARSRIAVMRKSTLRRLARSCSRVFTSLEENMPDSPKKPADFHVESIEQRRDRALKRMLSTPPTPRKEKKREVKQGPDGSDTPKS